eukprot:gene25917-33876_t
MDSNGYLKMIDFGFAKKFPFMKNDQKQDKTFTLCGTPEYLAPEIVISKGYDKGVDYWALGCLIYELFLARTPFQADYTTKIFQNIIAADKVLEFPAGMDPQHVALVKKLLSVNPSFRLGNLSGGNKTIPAPYSPPMKNALDSSNFEQYEEADEIPHYDGNQEPFANF